jgi:hypothetical protein
MTQLGHSLQDSDRRDATIAIFLDSRRAARELNPYYQGIKGTPELLGKICNGP